MHGVTSPGVMLLKIRYLYRDVDRHGNVRFYVRRNGRKLRIEEQPGTDAFLVKYHELLVQPQLMSRSGAGPPTLRPLTGTYRWLVSQYFGSQSFKRLDASTQATRRRVLEETCREPIRSDSDRLYAELPLQHVTIKSLRVLRDRKATLPGAASDRVKAIRAAFKWAFEDELIGANPARDLTKPRLTGPGFHSWTVEEVERFERRHEVGTKARLALALMLWTGVRRSDVVCLGRQHARGGWLRFVQAKNRRRKPVTIEVPILPQLQRVLEASPVGDLTYLVTDYGQPFTVAGFGNWFRERCREAGVPGSAHGLRKAGAATAAENGATAHQLMAIFGWLTLAEAQRYTEAARRKRLAKEAMGLLVRRDGEQD